MNTLFLVFASIVKISQHDSEYKNKTCPKMFDSFTSDVNRVEQKISYTWTGDPIGILKHTLGIWIIFLLIVWICGCACKNCWAPWESLIHMRMYGITLPFLLLGAVTIVLIIKKKFHDAFKARGGLPSDEFVLSGHSLVYISTEFATTWVLKNLIDKNLIDTKILKLPQYFSVFLAWLSSIMYILWLYITVICFHTVSEIFAGLSAAVLASVLALLCSFGISAITANFLGKRCRIFQVNKEYIQI